MDRFYLKLSWTTLLQAQRKLLNSNPLFSVSVLFPAWNGIMNGYSPERIGQKVMKDFPVLMTAELAFWPLFNMAVFKHVPLNLQSTCVYFGTIVWAIILSAIEERAMNSEYIKEDIKWILPIIDERKWLDIV